MLGRRLDASCPAGGVLRVAPRPATGTSGGINTCTFTRVVYAVANQVGQEAQGAGDEEFEERAMAAAEACLVRRVSRGVVLVEHDWLAILDPHAASCLSLGTTTSVEPDGGYGMAVYAVVITPEPEERKIRGENDTPGVQVQATIRVETGPPSAHITEMTVRSTAPGGLTHGSLPTIDLRGVVAALLSGVRPATLDDETRVQAPTQHTEHAEPTQRGERPKPTAAAERPSAVQPAEGVQRSDGLGVGRTLTPSAPSAAADTDESALATDAGRSDSSAKVSGSPRVYRRMPDVDEVRSAYERIGTVTGLAELYGVPRHTAQGWMGRIRALDS